MLKPKDKFARRRRRNRYALQQRAKGRPRLSVFRSGRHIYGQIIDDKAGVTLVAASTLEKELKGQLGTGADREAAKQVGELLARRAKEAGIEQVVFDRGGYRYHGRVKALAEGARDAGLAL